MDRIALQDVNKGKPTAQSPQRKAHRILSLPYMVPRVKCAPLALADRPAPAKFSAQRSARVRLIAAVK
jgi:hypothetical protein